MGLFVPSDWFSKQHKTSQVKLQASGAEWAMYYNKNQKISVFVMYFRYSINENRTTTRKRHGSGSLLGYDWHCNKLSKRLMLGPAFYKQDFRASHGNGPKTLPPGSEKNTKNTQYQEPRNSLATGNISWHTTHPPTHKHNQNQCTIFLICAESLTYDIR